ncbi:ORF6C domain-containing protein [Bacillus cereus]|nr:ORF6C domain-containing protein [Bacillus cereus]MDA2572661.1 ORF6C domain-containing protein [Bacillus cereus]
MNDQLTATNELHILGTQNIAGYQFTGIEGGFGESKKAMLVKEIAEIHNKDTWKINERINDNRKRFKDGIDIIDLKTSPFNGYVLENLKNQGILTQSQIGNAKNIYLLSERGYAKLLKILEDDTAWELYDQFVDGYFNMREQQQIQNDPMSILKLTFQALEGQKQEIQHIKTDVKDLQENTPLFAVECDEVVKTVNKTVVRLLGGKQANAYQDKSTRDKVYKDIYRQLRRQFDVTSYKAIKRRYLETVKAEIARHELPIVLSEEIEYINNQLTAEL